VSLRRLALPLALGAALVLPAVADANHVSIQAGVAARVAERVSARAWRVEVTWNATCVGAAPGKASFQGSLYLVDLDTGERIYLGGVFSGSGKTDQLVYARDRAQRLGVELTISCFEDGSLHSSGTAHAAGGAGIVPPSFEGHGGAGSGRGPGGDYGSGDPTEPLRSGGCEEVLQGTAAADHLNGTSGGEVIFGFGAGDRIRGRGGHDCLIGGPGNDRLYGQGGYDVLTGGRGKDVLVGGPGRNSYDAGPGRDYVNARNGRRELVRCGRGRDRARVDRRDRVRSCERVSRPRR
jgi:hypothetical protein